MLQAQATDSKIHVGSWRPDAVFSNTRRRYRAKSYSGAPRPMKMGNTASPWRYDVAAYHAFQLVVLRAPAILHYAFGGACAFFQSGSGDPAPLWRLSTRHGTR